MPVDGMVENGRRIEKILLGLADEFGPRNAAQPVGTAIRKTLRPVTSDIRNSTPVDEGHLRNATRITVSKTQRDTYVAGGAGWFFGRRTDATLQQGLAIEAGNERQRATPVLRPAFRRNVGRMTRMFFSIIDDEIRKATRRLTKRLGQGKLRIR